MSNNPFKCRDCGCLKPFDETSEYDITICIDCESKCDACNNPGEIIGHCEICGHAYAECCDATDTPSEYAELCCDCEAYEI